MRHWTVSLVREGSVAREWHVWADVLTVGSHGAAKVRLPLPAEPWALRIAELPEPAEFQVAEFHLRIADTTAERSNLWERAQVRIESARERAEREADPPVATGPSTLQTTVTALCLAGLTHWFAGVAAHDGSESSDLHPIASLASAPALQDDPTAPFAESVCAPRQDEAGRLVAGISRSKAPASVRAAIGSMPSAHSEHASQGSGGALFALAPQESPRIALVAASWPASAPQAWDSLDQPPPEPPH